MDIENLEWCSKSENIKHAYKLGLKSIKGEKHHHILNEIQVLEIINLLDTTLLNSGQIARLYKVKRDCIKNIIRGKTWTYLSKFSRKGRKCNHRGRQNDKILS